MPVLHNYKAQTGAYVKAWVRGSIVTFQLNGAGHKRLKEAGLHDGAKFPLNLLLDLIRKGDAFTRGDEASTLATRHEAEQFVFDFEEDLAAEKILPACEETGQIDDLHLTFSEAGTRILASSARNKVEGVSLSVPLALLDAGGIQFLIESGKIDPDAPCVEILRAWLSANLAEAWEAFAASNRVRQQGLDLQSPDELGFS